MQRKKWYNYLAIKNIWSNHKRIILITFAVLFLVVLYVVKNGLYFGIFHSSENKTNDGLTYNSALIGDLVNKDTDGDGVLDWEEGLWGTDPTKPETNPGVPDLVTINKLKGNTDSSGGSNSATANESLTQTDKFSRELFSTIAATTQSGSLDQATVDKISQSLADRIQNNPQRKVYTLADLNINKTDNSSSVKAYASMLANMRQKYPFKNNVMDVLQKFTADPENADSSVLKQLDPVISETKLIISAMVKMSVPSSIAPAHLELINSLQRLLENISDIQLYDTDVIVALGGISQYSDNETLLETAVSNLGTIINNKLNN